MSAQEPTVVQPGTPGRPTKTLPANTHASLPPTSQKDVEFMQGMIMHHSQAVEMTALIASHSTNKELRLLGDRISHSQADEIRFMQRWLITRGQSTEMPMPKMDMSMPGMNMSGMSQPMLMPGMLTPQQMEAFAQLAAKNSTGCFLRE